jgi:hypothetical protein
MRWLFLLLVIPSVACAAANDATLPADRRDYQSKLDKENVDFLRALARLIATKGFTNVRVIPQMFVVTAVGPDGKPRTMIIDSNSLKTFGSDNQMPDPSTLEE